MAVVAIFALVASVAMPNLSRLQIRKLDAAAERLIGQIEMARQRAIVTGIPHRLAIDIDGGGYRVEWLGRRDTEPTSANTTPAQDADWTAYDQPLDLTAPRSEAREFHPVEGLSGRTVWLSDAILIAGVETTGGWIEQGESFISFAQDGSADPTTVVLEHEGGHVVSLEILPLASNVRVVHEEI